MSRPAGRRAALPAILAASLLAACGGGAPTPATPQDDDAQASSVVRVGDVTVRANVVRTSNLDAGSAARYGIDRDPEALLLLVGVRRGEGAVEASLPAEVRATVTDLRGRSRAIELRELRSQGATPGETLLDYAGTVQVDLPDTLRFEIEADWGGPRRAQLALQRDFNRP